MTKIVMFLLFAAVLVGCKTYNEEEKKSFDGEIKTYLEKKGITCKRSDSGLYYTIIEPGEGRNIHFEDIVSFSYTGSFINGQKFDQQKKPVEFAVKDLIGAWKEIMLELKAGAKVFLVTPPQLGYGERELDDIPANSILVYEITVHGVK
jgi:FKBP-type peptidyl-prolyl cis-trans isomerase FkpA